MAFKERNISCWIRFFVLTLVIWLSCPLTCIAGGVTQRIEARARSQLHSLVSAEEIEREGGLQYQEFLSSALKKNSLLAPDDKRLKRVIRIAGRLLPFAKRFNDRAGDWEWEVNVVRSSTINAFCLPGGKIAVFTGVLDRLKLSDDETAMMIGHEIAHAVFEHARERASKRLIGRIGTRAIAAFAGKDAGELARTGANLLALKFSRDDELDADLAGMELAARAGFDPRAAVSLWKKMAQASKANTAEFLSTHPSGERRIEAIKLNLDDVLPLYKKAR